MTPFENKKAPLGEPTQDYFNDNRLSISSQVGCFHLANFRFSISDRQQNPYATNFAQKNIRSIEEFLEAMKYDHAPGVFKDGQRNKENWRGSDLVVIDVDDGLTITEFEAKFKERYPEVGFVIKPSRNHQREKHGKTCDRFHVYILVSPCFHPDIIEQYTELVKRLAGEFGADQNATDPARFFFGSDGEALVCDGKKLDWKKLIPHRTEEPKQNKQQHHQERQGHETLEEELKLAIRQWLPKLKSQRGGNLPLDNYAHWIDAGIILKRYGFTFEDFLTTCWGEIDPEEARRKWDSFDTEPPPNGEPLTLATLVKFIQKVEPDFHLAKRERKAINKSLENSKLTELHLARDFENILIEKKVRFFDDDWFYKPKGHAHFTKDEKRTVKELLKRCIEKERLPSFDLATSNKERAKFKTEAKINAILKLASSSPKIVIGKEDTILPYEKLPVLNGVVNLRTGELEEVPEGKMYLTYVPTPYNPNALAPSRFIQFLKQVTAKENGEDDLEAFDYVLASLASALIGGNEQQKIFVIYGPPGTGKSTLLEIVNGVLGPLSKTIDKGFFIRSPFSNTNNLYTLANLAWARVVSLQEIAEEDKKRIDGSLLKNFYDWQQAREIYKKPFEFKPQYTLFISSNFPLPFNEQALVDRIVYLHFTNRFRNSKEQKPGLALEIINAEAGNILKLLVDRARQLLQEKKLPPYPARWKNATIETMQEEDTLAAFIELYCETDRSSGLYLKEVHNRYIEFLSGLSEEEGTSYGKVDERTLSKELKSKGWKHKRTKKGVYFFGFRWKDNHQQNLGLDQETQDQVTTDAQKTEEENSNNPTTSPPTPMQSDVGNPTKSDNPTAEENPILREHRTALIQRIRLLWEKSKGTPIPSGEDSPLWESDDPAVQKLKTDIPLREATLSQLVENGHIRWFNKDIVLISGPEAVKYPFSPPPEVQDFGGIF